MTRAELLSRMTHAEFVGWLALYTIEHQERERAQKDAEAKANARKMAGRMRGGGF